MSRITVLPPATAFAADGVKPAGWWHESDDGTKLVCDLCPRGCSLAAGKRGFCFVRQNLDGRMVTTTYGRSSGFCIDPIEKKPLNHFYPGSSVLSFGTAGCNLGCKFCQNWEISKSREVDAAGQWADPETVARAALELGCRSVAFTYNDPVVWAEYAIDCAKACRAVGVKTVAVTAGYIMPSARKTFYEVMDAANVDLKGFTEDFYRELTNSRLAPVQDTLRWLAREQRVAGSDHPAHSREERLRGRIETHVRVARRGPGARRAAALHGLSSRFPHERHPAHAARHPGEGPRDCQARRAEVCLYGKRERSQSAKHLLPSAAGRCSSGATATV